MDKPFYVYPAETADIFDIAVNKSIYHIHSLMWYIVFDNEIKIKETI